MSYILDALRRAEAERERGAVPSLQSQQHTVSDDDAVATRPRSLVWAVIVLGAAVLVLLAWNLLGGAAPAPRAPIEGSITAPVPAPLPTLQPAPATPTAAASAAAATVSAAPTDAAARPASQPTAAPVAAARPSPKGGLDSRRAAAASPPKRTAATAQPKRATEPPAAEPRVHSQAELPEEIRRDLPKLVIGGSSYSGDAASRMVMINGQVFHEGDRLAPDLVLERIRLKSAVLAFKGWRYEVLF